MVTDRVSESGTCTLTVSQDAQTVSATSSGMADATVTYCANLSVVLPPDSKGTWRVTVMFDEAGFHGQADSAVTLP
ncbi:hypothetical protein SAMN06296010_0372 [Agreia pratensis]|uniref:Uncharacterized protein n=1 Tax=Agreia pratensis TaxID=150121 RepID=A0A1X7ICR4_9MICO|nr:hypothetical protein SAMN06296010_0372 [Agreia pratensis]